MSLLLCVTIAALAALTAAAVADDGLTAAPMHFGSDGRFKILHITDTHLHDNNVRQSTRLIAMACDAEQPDLVMLTGDLAPEKTYERTEKRVDSLMQVFESRKIPVAVTFGNHDSENGAYTREQVMALYNAYACSISIDDGEQLTGCGTYLIPICASGSDEQFSKSAALTPIFALTICPQKSFAMSEKYAALSAPIATVVCALNAIALFLYVVKIAPRESMPLGMSHAMRVHGVLFIFKNSCAVCASSVP